MASREYICKEVPTENGGYLEIETELIRCRDCKYYEETDETIGTCLLTASGAHVKGYCAWAERRGEHDKTDLCGCA